MTRILPAIALIFLFHPFSVYANPTSYSINTQKTTITLSWHAFGDVSKACMGRVTGEITLDAGNERDDRIDVTIPVASLEASNALLTYQLKSRPFFDAENYPKIAFISSRVVALGNGHFRLFGRLQIKNVTRPVILNASLDAKIGELSATKNIVLHASTAISRAAFNMDSFAALVDDTVTINIEIQARPYKGA